jgi:ATP synthase F1 delta subunit
MEEIAEVYSRALFDVAKEQDVLDDVHDQLGQFVEELDGNRDLQVFFFSPYFSSQEKKDGIGKAISGADDNFVRFLELLAERHRMPAIFRIRRDFDALYAEERKLLPVTITSAIELEKDLVKDIRKKIEEQTDRKVDLTTKVDPNVLGGLVLRVGNLVMDGSIRARLERLRKQVAKAAA